MLLQRTKEMFYYDSVIEAAQLIQRTVRLNNASRRLKAILLFFYPVCTSFGSHIIADGGSTKCMILSLPFAMTYF